jgi:hypothetical protein
VVVKKPDAAPAKDASNGSAAVLIRHDRGADHAEARRTDTRVDTRRPDVRGTQTPRPASPRSDDDGTMYNPFADALKKMQEKKKK